MEKNKQYTAVDFIYDELKKYVRYDNRNAVETFDRIFEQAREMYEDKMEAEIIKQCATLSTIKASSYEDGFYDGYMKASKTTATTTNTTHFCEVFEPAFQPSPKVATPRTVPCKKCGKSLWQHAKSTNTI